MASDAIPTSLRFVTQLLESLPSASSNPLESASEEVKKQFLTLQILFPNELLPALDVLDRRLVTRFHIVQGHETTPPNHDPHLASQPDERRDEDSSIVYYVRSAQQRSSRYSSAFDSNVSYQVYLSAWHCSCPAFAFAAFPATYPEPPIPAHETGQLSSTNQFSSEEGSPTWAEAECIFGGTTLGEGVPPVCKHLLACVLAEKGTGLFGESVVERAVTVEEAAGWAAGWGD